MNTLIFLAAYLLLIPAGIFGACLPIVRERHLSLNFSTAQRVDDTTGEVDNLGMVLRQSASKQTISAKAKNSVEDQFQPRAEIASEATPPFAATSSIHSTKSASGTSRVSLSLRPVLAAGSEHTSPIGNGRQTAISGAQ